MANITFTLKKTLLKVFSFDPKEFIETQALVFSPPVFAYS